MSRSFLKTTTNMPSKWNEMSVNIRKIPKTDPALKSSKILTNIFIKKFKSKGSSRLKVKESGKLRLESNKQLNVTTRPSKIIDLAKGISDVRYISSFKLFVNLLIKL